MLGKKFKLYSPSCNTSIDADAAMGHINALSDAFVGQRRWDDTQCWNGGSLAVWGIFGMN